MKRLLLTFLATMALAALHSGASGGELKIASFKFRGVKIVYATRGKGEPVVLIHGWLGSAGLNWELPGISAALAKDFHIIEMDVRGHGLSDKPKKAELYGEELVEDVNRLLDHLRIKKAHIVGYSMGGIIAGKFAVKHPDRVRSVILGGMGWLEKGGLGQWLFDQIGKNDPNAQALALCGRSLARLALTRAELESIKVPVTVLVGDKDPVKELYVKPLRTVRKDWPVVEIKDGDHLSCVLRPQFKEAIRKWLTRQLEPVKGDVGPRRKILNRGDLQAAKEKPALRVDTSVEVAQSQEESQRLLLWAVGAAVGLLVLASGACLFWLLCPRNQLAGRKNPRFAGR
jgi:pimeloyl-ACP methyl ester carboxylesterase